MPNLSATNLEDDITDVVDTVIKQTEQLIKMLVLLLLHLIDATANYLVAKMPLTLSHLYSALF